MAITIGNSSVRDIYLGNSKVDSVFLGDVLVYGNLANDPEDTYNKFVFDTSRAIDSFDEGFQPIVTLRDYRAGDTTHWNGYTDWGDGTINKELTHKYTTSGVYTVKTKYTINDSYGSITNNTSNMFIRCDAINKNIKDLSYLFYGCDKLTSVNLSNLDKSLYYKAAYAFYDCNLPSIDLSGFKFTGNVSNMFGYGGASSINLSGADFTRATGISNMFYKGFYTTDVMLYDCSDEDIIKLVPALQEKILDGTHGTWNGTIYIDEFKDTYPAPNYGWSYKYRIKHIETELDNTFNYFVFNNTTGAFLSRYRAGDTTSWNGLTDWGDNTIDTNYTHKYKIAGTYTVKTKYTLYGGLYVLPDGSTEPYINTSITKVLGINRRITDGHLLFFSCENLESVDLSNIINYGYLSKSDNMFLHCESLKSIDLSGIDTHNVNDMDGMFCFCESLTELDLSSFDTSNVTNMEYMFSVCPSLTQLDLSSFDTSKVTNMRYMFNKCPSLTRLDISNFNMDNVTDYSNMFYGCDNLTLDNIIMTNCNEATKAKITEAFNNKNTTQ